MAFRVEQPWMLLLLPVLALAVVLIDRKYRVRRHSLKRDVSLALRLIVVALLSLALAVPSVVVSSGKASRWILLDVSDSTAERRAQMERRVIEAVDNADGGEQLGVIAFGNGAMVETSLSDKPTFTGVQTAVGGDASDLSSALRLASVLLTDGVGGITVLSDGLSTVDAATISQLAASGVKVDTALYEPEAVPDAQLTELIAPSSAYEGQSLTIQAVIDASESLTGTLVLYQNGELTATREVKLEKGENRFAFSDTASRTGLMRYEARLMSASDGRNQNNLASTYVKVSGKPNVLLITQTQGAKDLLAAAGLTLTDIKPADMPDDSAGYLPYDAVVLNDVGYDEAGESQWQALSSAVKTLGRGLCVLGGDNSYALGGYRGTALEELLPVTIDVRNKQRIPALSLVLAIDKSGSMSMGRFGTPLIEVAKEAAIQAVGVLSDKDRIGVIGFDDTAKWVVPFQNVTDVSAIESMIGTLRADGGTAFYSPFSEGYRVLSASDTPQKHMIFLSDGQPADNGYQELAIAMSNAGITLTTVAVGSGADTRAMTLLATLGGGRAYSAGEFDNLPKIFTKETMMVNGSYVQNRSFTPVVTEHSALTDFDGFPMLDGYLTTAEKQAASVAMVSDEEDPLLAWWQTGAGKVVAWTSDAEGAWTQSYLSWQNAPAFFGGMVAKVLPGGTDGGTVSASVKDETLHIQYEVDGAEEDATTEAVVIAPDGSETRVTLSAVGVGQYEGAVEASQQGAYSLRVEQRHEGELMRSAESGAVKGFAAEYDLRAQPTNSLQTLSDKTGGQVLGEADSLFASSIQAAQSSRPLREAFCIAALLIWLLGIALDKLPWETAIEKLLAKKAQKDETEKTHQDESASIPQKPKKPKPEKRERFDEAERTADALLNAARSRRTRGQ